MKSLAIIFLSLLIPITTHAKHYIVTGATGGLGGAVATQLASEGHELTVIGRNADKLKTFKVELAANANTKVNSIILDYSDLESIYQFQETLKQASTSIDGILVVTPRPTLDDSLLPSAQAWESMLKSCFIGPLELFKVTNPYLSEEAKVVILSGITSKQVLPNHASYGILRAMWLAEAKGLSHQLGERGIHVNTVSPGGTLTDSYLAKLDKRAHKNNRSREEQIKAETQNIPLKQYGQPENVASLITFLLSDKSKHISGANITIDGGFTVAY